MVKLYLYLSLNEYNFNVVPLCGFLANRQSHSLLGLCGPQISLTERLLNRRVMFCAKKADGLEIMLNIHIDPCFRESFSERAPVPFGKTLLIVH